MTDAPSLAPGCLIVAVAVGCQQLLGLDAGDQSSTSSGGTGATASTSSNGTAGGGVSSTSGTSSGTGGSTSTTSSSSTSSSSGTSTSSSTSTSSTGSSSTSSSSGTTDPCVGPVVIPLGDMIDDMEAMQPHILMQGNRQGPWFTYNNGGAQTPAPTAPCLPSPGGYCPASLYSMHTSGTNITSLAGIGFDLDHAGVAARQPYDASSFHGVAFWGKTSLVSQGIHFMVLEPQTVAAGGTEGGTCTVPDGGLPCGDGHKTDITLTPTWTQYAFTFKQLKQAGWGQSVGPLDATQLLAMQFFVDACASFDIWIDDIGFY